MLNEILAANPNDPFARYGLALEFANAGDTETALAHFDQLLAANPDYTPAYQMAGQLLVKAGRSGEARSRLEAGIATADRSGNAHAKNEMQTLLDEIAY